MRARKPERRVAVQARTLAMTGDAEARLSACFDGMARAESCAVQTRKPHLVEGKAPRQRGYDPHAVTARTIALAVAGGAKVASAGGPDAMFAFPVPRVHEMARRQRVLAGKVDMAAVAVTRAPLVLVLMASEADRHLGAQRFGLFDADLHVAPHAVAARGRHVRAMFESQMRSRELGAASNVRFAVTIFTSARVVRLRVALHAVRGLGEMKWPLIAGFGRPLVTGEAADPLEDVGAVLERVLRLAADAEHPRACRQDQRDDEQIGGTPVHGKSKLRAIRKRPFTSN